MSFREELEEHITTELDKGLLPDGDIVIEMEVPNPKPGPQASGDEGGPKSGPSRVFPWLGSHAPASFGSASSGKKFPAPAFSNQNRQIPPAKFGGAAKLKESKAVVDAVLADLEARQESAE